MSKPTEPGFYWAKHKGLDFWEPVRVRKAFDMFVTMLDSKLQHEMRDFEFGPRIPQYEPDIHTRDTAVELPPITDADLEGA